MSAVQFINESEFDFYYSAEQEGLAKSSMDYTTTTFKGDVYTLAIPKGAPKPKYFDDYIYLGTGTMAEVKTSLIWHE